MKGVETLLLGVSAVVATAVGMNLMEGKADSFGFTANAADGSKNEVGGLLEDILGGVVGLAGTWPLWAALSALYFGSMITSRRVKRSLGIRRHR